jgi:hypothetical protein
VGDAEVTRRWRQGQSWSAKDPAKSPLVTIIEDGVGEPDERGHRADDRLVGAVGREDAALIVAAVNALPQHAAALREMRKSVGFAAEVCPRCAAAMGCDA